MKTGKVCFGEKCIQVEIAETIREKSKGLMHREYLHNNHGMLFVFSFESIYPFTMKNTRFPLDIIWINRHEEIVHISEYIKPCKTFFCPPINPWKRAKYVLEVNAGTAKELDLKVGDKTAIFVSE